MPGSREEMEMLKDSVVIPTLPVVDMAEARAFYEQILGLEPGPNSGEGTAHYVCGDGTQFILYRRDTPTTADHTALGFTVQELDSVMRELVSRGVTFEQYDQPGLKTDEHGVAESEGMRSAWFKDPSGNILALGEFAA